MFRGLFAKKSIKNLIAESENEKHSLKRHLGPFNIIALGLGSIIGAGIFVLTGQAAAEYAGPAITLSFIFAALICVFAALCYAELASFIPISGSAYTYAYVAMGELTAWVIGWALTMEYLFSFSTVAVGWSGYCISLLKDLGITIPFFISNAPFDYDPASGWKVTGALLNLPAMFIIAGLGILVGIGIKAAARFNNVMVFIKMAVIVLFIICGIKFVNAGNWTPLIPENTGIFGQYGWSGVFRGAGVVFFAFIGFDALSTLAQEARNPQRDLPIGMLGSLAISTLVYIVMALLMTGIVSYKLLGVSDPVAVAVNAFGSGYLWMRYVIKIAIIAGLTTVILVMMLSQARIFYIMAQDGLMPAPFGKIHPKFSTPFNSTMCVMTLGIIFSGLLPVGMLGQLTSMGALLAFAIVCFGVLVLRYTQPNHHRPFKCPLVPFVPIAGTLACLFQMALLPGVTWVQFLIWMGIGCALYFGYGIRHSKVLKTLKHK